MCLYVCNLSILFHLAAYWNLLMTLLGCVSEHLWILIPDVCLVLFAEILVDWTKHAFITKFNHIRCEVGMMH